MPPSPHRQNVERRSVASGFRSRSCPRRRRADHFRNRSSAASTTRRQRPRPIRTPLRRHPRPVVPVRRQRSERFAADPRLHPSWTRPVLDPYRSESGGVDRGATRTVPNSVQARSRRDGTAGRDRGRRASSPTRAGSTGGRSPCPPPHMNSSTKRRIPASAQRRLVIATGSTAAPYPTAPLTAVRCWLPSAVAAGGLDATTTFESAEVASSVGRASPPTGGMNATQRSLHPASCGRRGPGSKW